jgi:hypothetical protein
MAENISSNVLFHFTNTFDRLKGILENGFLPRYCPEYTLSPDDRKAASKQRPPLHAIPMVCFCDIPISLIRNHLHEYGHYGIGLCKEWGLKRGLAPVTYTHQNATTLKPMRHLAAKAGKTRDQPTATELQLLAAYTKPFIGPAWRSKCRPKVQPRVSFYDEREWRYVPQDPKLPLFLEWRYYNERSKLEHLDKGLKKHALTIDPDSIWYLVLPFEKDEENVLHLHDFVTGLYTRRDAALVATTIMTTDCIEHDV